MEIKKIVQTLRNEGRITLKEGHGKIIELITPDKWDAIRDSPEGVFLISDLFQIRSLALPFSEVSLDIVELSSPPIIYHTPAGKGLTHGPVIENVVKFSLIKEGFWNQVIFNFGRPLIYQGREAGELENTVRENFPLAAGKVREMFLGPEGEVKILIA